MSKRPIEPLPLKSSKNSRPPTGVVGRVVTRVVVVVVAGRAVVVVLRCVVVDRRVVVVAWPDVVVVRRVVGVALVVAVVPWRVVVVALVVDVVAGARPEVVAVLVDGATRMVAGVRPAVVAVDPVVGASELGVDCWEAPAGAVSELVAVLPEVEPVVDSVPAAGSVVSTDDGEPSPWTTTTGRADGAPSPPSAEIVDSTASTVPPSELTGPA